MRRIATAPEPRHGSEGPGRRARRRSDCACGVDGLPAARVRVEGPELPGGAYALLVAVLCATRVAFGRHAGGDPLEVSPGWYVYVGSALGERGRPLLARLLRHATRATGDLHPIWHEIACCAGLTLGAKAPSGPRPKQLKWHVDYLLEDPAANLTEIFAWRSATRIEHEIARSMELSPHTSPLSRGLGAGDDPGHTHLLRLDGGSEAWTALVGELSP